MSLAEVGAKIAREAVASISQRSKNWNGAFRMHVNRTSAGKGSIETEGVAWTERVDWDEPPTPKHNQMFNVYIRLEPEYQECERVVNINSIWMDLTWQRRGLFTSMLDALETYLRQMNKRRMGCGGLMVQGITDARLRASLLRREGWEEVAHEALSVMVKF